jgi:hypothetical protein
MDINTRIDEYDSEVESNSYSTNVQETRRMKVALQDDKSFAGRIKLLWYYLIMFVFKLQEFLIIFLTVLIAAGISLGSTMATGDAHMAMLYSVCGGTLAGSLFLLIKICIRAKHGKAWVDVEVDKSNFALLLVVVFSIVISSYFIYQIDLNCTGKPSLCNIKSVFTFN